jgi:DNA end-binding protein Ku
VGAFDLCATLLSYRRDVGNHLPVPQDDAEQPRRGNVVNMMDARRKSLGSAAAPAGRSTKKPAAGVRPEPKKGIGLVKSSASL